MHFTHPATGATLMALLAKGAMQEYKKTFANEEDAKLGAIAEGKVDAVIAGRTALLALPFAYVVLRDRATLVHGYIGAGKMLVEGTGKVISDYKASVEPAAKAAGQAIIDAASGKNATYTPSAITGATDATRRELEGLPPKVRAIGGEVKTAVTDTQTAATSGWGAIPDGATKALSEMDVNIQKQLAATSTEIMKSLSSMSVNSADVMVLMAGLVSDAWAGAFLQVANSLSGIADIGNVYMGDFQKIIQDGATRMSSTMTSSMMNMNLLVTVAWIMVASAIRTGVDNSVAATGGLAGRLLVQFSAYSNLLYGAGNTIMYGFERGLRSRMGEIEQMLRDFTNRLPSWKGPIEKDRKLFEPIGNVIMQSLINGFKIGAKDVKSYLNGFTDDIAGMSLGNVTSSLAAATSDTSTVAPNQGVTVNQTVYYPQAEPTSRTVNRGLQLAAAL